VRALSANSGGVQFRKAIKASHGFAEDGKLKATEQQIEQFRDFALRQLRNGGADLTVDEVYDLWRAECPSDDEVREDVLAVRASLRDMERGEIGRAFDDFTRDFRARHNITDAE
jgi:hypothetical protein